MGDAQDRLARIEAMLYGHTRRTVAAEALARRGEIARLYVSWRLGDIEEPEFENPEDARLWEKMAEYEEAHARVVARVADKPDGAA